MRLPSHYFSIIIQKSIAEIISESRRGYIGFLWWIIEPALYMSVFYLIFKVIFNRGGEDWVSFLLIGLVVWKWFSSSIDQCPLSISVNIGLIRQVYIPKYVFPGMIAMTNTIKFLIVFIILILFLVFMGKNPNITWLSLPILMGVQLLVILSIGGILTAIVPFFPDLKLIVENGIILLFFLSGIFFDISSTPSSIRSYLYLNPMAGIIESYRMVLLDGIWPNWFLLAMVFLASVPLYFLSWYLLRRFDGIYAKII